MLSDKNIVVQRHGLYEPVNGLNMENTFVKRGLDSRDSKVDVPKVELPIEFEGIIATSLPMQAVVRRILEAAAVDIPVLILGETGTGKDLVAAAIHKRSQRQNKPYITVNTGAIAPH